MAETTVTDVETGGRSGKGLAPSTVTVLNFDPTLGCDPATFQPCSDRALSTLKVVGDAFAKSFAFTQSLPSDQIGPLFGFFIEEKLLGGHVRQRRHLICVIRQLIYAPLGTIFWDFKCRRATFRCTYNVGPNWRAPSHRRLPQVFPAVRPGCQGRNVSQRFRCVRELDRRDHKLGGE